MRYSNFTQEFAWGALLLVMTINFACNKIADSIKDKKEAADPAPDRKASAPSHGASTPR